MAQQDIVNGDFEFWDTIPGTNGLEDPVGWTSNNYVVNYCTTGVYLPGISKSNDAYSGTFSLQISPTNHPNGTRISMIAGNCQFSTCWGFNCDYYPVTYIHQKIVGYYKFPADTSVNDTANIHITQILYDSISGSSSSARSGGIWFTPAINWTYFEVPIGYNTFPQVEGNLFYIAINLFSNNTSTNPNGYLLIDSLAVVPDVVSGLEKEQKVKVKLTPNPVQEKILIETRNSFTIVEICDLSGRVLRSIPFGREIDVSLLSQGIYFLCLKGNEEKVVEKFVKE